MVNHALFIRLETKPGKEDDVVAFLASGLTLGDAAQVCIAARTEHFRGIQCLRRRNGPTSSPKRPNYCSADDEGRRTARDTVGDQAHRRAACEAAGLTGFDIAAPPYQQRPS